MQIKQIIGTPGQFLRCRSREQGPVPGNVYVVCNIQHKYVCVMSSNFRLFWHLVSVSSGWREMCCKSQLALVRLWSVDTPLYKLFSVPSKKYRLQEQPKPFVLVQNVKKRALAASVIFLVPCIIRALQSGLSITAEIDDDFRDVI